MKLTPQVKSAQQTKVLFTVWHGGRKHVACLRTVKSMVQNMIDGVTKGFLYKMRLVYAHFPINAIPSDDGKSLQIRNFCESCSDNSGLLVTSRLVFLYQLSV